MKVKSKCLGKIVAVLTAAMASFMLISISAFAANAGADATISAYLSENNQPPSKAASYFKKGTEKDMESGGEYSDAGYDYYKSKDGSYYFIKNSDTDAASKAIAQVKKSKDAANNIGNVTDGLNLQPDTQTAVQALQGFAPILRTVLGLMIILISVGMTIFSAFDICYIAFPVFRNKCEEQKQSGHGIMAGRRNKETGETKLRFVTDDAQYAVVAADTVESGKNPFVIYFTKRILSYILLAILLFILISGNITVVTDLAVRVVSGITDLISNI